MKVELLDAEKQGEFIAANESNDQAVDVPVREMYMLVFVLVPLPYLFDFSRMQNQHVDDRTIDGSCSPSVQSELNLADSKQISLL